MVVTKILDEYFKLQQEIYEYFDFKEDYVVIPIEDRGEFSWAIIDDEEIWFGDKNDIVNDTGNYYADEIYKQRFYDRWIYRAKDYTMIMVDTHTDGNKFLAIFDNSKEVK